MITGYLNVDDDPDVPWIRPDADFSEVEAVADRTFFHLAEYVQPGEKLDTRLFDQFPSEAKVMLSVEFTSPRDVPVDDYLAQLLDCERPDVIIISGLRKSGLEYLATRQVEDDRKIGVVFGFSRQRTDKQLIKRVDAAGYDTSDNLHDEFYEKWRYSRE